VNMVLDLMTTFVDLSVLRVLRVCRVLRAFRVLRGLRVVRDLRFLTASIISSMCSLVWGIGLLMLVLFMFAMFVMQTLVAFGDSGTALGIEVKTNYGTVADSMTTLFMAVSGGKDWDDLLMPLRAVSDMYLGFFIVYICVVLFGVMNVITAVFCENASQIAHVDKDLVIQDEIARQTEERRQIKEFFNFYDDDSDGSMTATELDNIINTQERAAMLGLLSIDAAEARCLFCMMDTENSGKVNIADYVDGILRLKGPAKGCDVALLLYEHKRLVVRFASFLCYTNECFEALFSALDVDESNGGMEHFMDEAFIREHERALKSEINNGFVTQLGYGSAKYTAIHKHHSNHIAAIRDRAMSQVIDRWWSIKGNSQQSDDNVAPLRSA